MERGIFMIGPMIKNLLLDSNFMMSKIIKMQGKEHPEMLEFIIQL